MHMVGHDDPAEEFVSIRGTVKQGRFHNLAQCRVAQQALPMTGIERRSDAAAVGWIVFV